MRIRTLFTFRPVYFLLAILLFVIEVVIALFVHDGFIRPYLGDVLVVMLIYCFVRSFFSIPVPAAAVLVLVFAFFIETLQAMNAIVWLGLEKSALARMVLGTHFAWMDIVAYIAGFLLILLAERLAHNRPDFKSKPVS